MTGARVKVMKEGVLIPRELFEEMVSIHARMERILATLETLADEEALKTIKESKEDS